MKHRKLGNTALNVSEISVGCSGFWGNKRFSEKKAHAIIDQAFDKGINFFDTGHNYCHYHAEPRLGRALKKLLANNDRSKIIISSKAGTTMPATPVFAKKTTYVSDFSPDYIERACQKSIQNLQCEYLDIFQLHGIPSSQITSELLDKLAHMKAQGLFRYLGMNSHAEQDLLYVSQHPEIFDVVLLDYNLLQLDREAVIDKLSAAGIGVLAGTVLAQGHLIKGKIGRIKRFSDVWYLARALMKPSSRRLHRNSKSMRNLLSSIKDMSAAQAAFTYVLDNKNISSCIFGTTQIPNLLEVIDVPHKILSVEDKLNIKNVFQELKEKISD